MESITKSKVMIITDSGNPVSFAAVDKDGKEMTFQVECVPLSQDSLKDCNGAGDSFVGGFLAHLATHPSDKYVSVFEYDIEFLKNAVKAGNLMAREVIQRYGCDFPSVDQIKQLQKDIK